MGSWGAAGALSFNDFKVLSAGEGGVIVTNDKAIYERAVATHDSALWDADAWEFAQRILVDD